MYLHLVDSKTIWRNGLGMRFAVGPIKSEKEENDKACTVIIFMLFRGSSAAQTR